MAVEGASAAKGRWPGWLERASDIRFVDYSHDGDDTLISLRCPRLAEAAEELYRQSAPWDTRPNPDDTAFESLRHVIDDVSTGDKESELYDRQLLTRLSRLKTVFGSRLQSIRLSTVEDGANPSPQTDLNRKVAEAATQLGASTPASRQVRIMGVLDMIRHSTRGFSLRLQSGEEVHGVMESEHGPNMLAGFFGNTVLVFGRAVYRPSGRLLRIDASGIEDGSGAPPAFREGSTATDSKAVRHGSHQILGRWPPRRSCVLWNLAGYGNRRCSQSSCGRTQGAHGSLAFHAGSRLSARYQRCLNLGGKALGKHLAAAFGLLNTVNRPLVSIVTHGEILLIAEHNNWGTDKRSVLRVLNANDAWIAACAKAAEATLSTTDRDFSHLESPEWDVRFVDPAPFTSGTA
jgi:hypothetical protein